MVLQAQDFSEVPADTAHYAQCAFPKGHPYLRLRDELESLYQKET